MRSSFTIHLTGSQIDQINGYVNRNVAENAQILIIAEPVLSEGLLKLVLWSEGDAGTAGKALARTLKAIDKKMAQHEEKP